MKLLRQPFLGPTPHFTAKFRDLETVFCVGERNVGNPADHWCRFNTTLLYPRLVAYTALGLDGLRV
jgi:hypothetical protein